MLTQGAPSPHESILLAKSPTTAAIRVGDWKLMINGGAGEDESDKGAKKRATKKGAREPVALYHLSEDIGEKNNLAEKEPARLAEMRAKLDALLKDAVPSGAK